jgi:hypothetical protein
MGRPGPNRVRKSSLRSVRCNDWTVTRRLKVFGVFRSGTNLITALLELNYLVEVVINEGGFKHAPVPAIFEGGEYRPFPLPVILACKDPYSWLVSMWRYMQGEGRRHTRGGTTWESFVTSPLTVFDGWYDNFPRYRFSNPVDYWNALNTNVLSLPPRDRHVVRYEDVIIDPVEVTATAAHAFSLPRRDGQFHVVEHRTRQMADRNRETIEDYVECERFDATPYLERSYLSQFTDAQLEWVSATLDDSLCQELGYSVTSRLPTES